VSHDSVKFVVGSIIVWECEDILDGGVYYLVRDEGNVFLSSPHFDRRYSPDGELCVVLLDTEFHNLYLGNAAVLAAVYGD
jgi:hypothetical protein